MAKALTASVRLLVHRADILGEGPCWDEQKGRLYWVDIRRQTIAWCDAGGRVGQWRLAIRPSALAPLRRGALLVAGERSIGVFDEASGEYETRVEFEAERPLNRTNDGVMGADGRFWFSTMQDGVSGAGAVYCLETDWSVRRVLAGLSIPNALATPGDGLRLYQADSIERTIYVHDLDPIRGLISNTRTFAVIDAPGVPDGAAVDEEGCLWNAQWDNWCVVRYAPDGSMDLRIALPVARPTSCAFGGADFTTLFVTSAREGLTDAALENQPLAGSVFAIATGIRGAPRPAFAG